MSKAKLKNPRNARRGTTPRQFRLSDQVIADLDYIAEYLSRGDGLPRSRADAIRVMSARLAEEFRKKDAEKSA